MCKIVFLVAVSKNGVIGDKGAIPWHYPEDIQRFKRITMGYPVVMGRKTWESLPKKPLAGRPNIVLTKNGFTDHRCHIYDSLKRAIFDFRDKKIFVIGGAQIFERYMHFADVIDVTYIDKEYEGDTYWPGIDLDKWFISKEKIDNDLIFVQYNRRVEIPQSATN